MDKHLTQVDCWPLPPVYVEVCQDLINQVKGAI